MKKVYVLLIIFLCFSAQIVANQLSFFNDGEEKGIARYYAAHLKGKLTSSGEKYDDSQLTASHSKYALNTLVKITNLENNLTVTVRINDHCKCDEAGRIVTLSKEAASKLGMIASGKVSVKLEVVSQPITEKVTDKALSNLLNKDRDVYAKEEIKEIKPAIATVPKISAESFSVNHTYDINGLEKNPKGFGVQVTALSSLDMVQDLYDELLKMGVKKEEIYVQVGAKDTGKIFKLMFGEFYTKEGANEKLNWLSQHGYKSIIRSYNNL
jgi:rare lipoprotein A